MITIMMMFAVILIFPSLLKSTGERSRARKQEQKKRDMLREEIKHGKRWG